MAKSPEEMKASMIAGLKEKTGKAIDEWLRIVAVGKPAKHKEIMTFLKSDHGLTHGYANLIALQYLGLRQSYRERCRCAGRLAVCRRQGGAEADLRRSDRKG